MRSMKNGNNTKALKAQACTRSKGMRNPTLSRCQTGLCFQFSRPCRSSSSKHQQDWQISPPAKFDDSKLIDTAKRTYVESAKRNPNTMGKTAACYSALQQITAIYRELLAS